MQTMTTIKPNTLQSAPILWTALPDCQQELLSGGGSGPGQTMTRPAPGSSDPPVTREYCVPATT
jgi:hypothetical protein